MANNSVSRVVMSVVMADRPSGARSPAEASPLASTVRLSRIIEAAQAVGKIGLGGRMLRLSASEASSTRVRKDCCCSAGM